MVGAVTITVGGVRSTVDTMAGIMVTTILGDGVITATMVIPAMDGPTGDGEVMDMLTDGAVITDPFTIRLTITTRIMDTLIITIETMPITPEEGGYTVPLASWAAMHCEEGLISMAQRPATVRVPVPM